MAVSSSSSYSTTSNGAAFRFSGLSSGIDTEAMITKLMEIESKPLTDLDANKATLTSELTAWKTVNSTVLGLDAALSRLTSASLYESRTVYSSDTSVLTAAASSGGDLGTYSVSVEALATTHQLISQGYDSDVAVVGSGTVSLKVGTATKTPITLAAGSTLANMRDAINKAGLGVTASILDQGEGAGTNRFRLVLNSGTSGLSGKVELTTSLSGDDPVMSDLTAAADSHVKIGSGASAIDVYSSSNTVSTALPGVTLSLKSASPGKAIMVGLSTDQSAIRTGVQGFLDTYNALAERFNTENYYDATTGKTGTLFGNSAMLSLQSRLVDETMATRNVNGAYNSLASIGIGLDAKGKLAITDTAAFSKALANPQDLKKLFADETNGVAVKMKAETKRATDGLTGTISLQEQALEQRIKILDESRLRIAERVLRSEENYRIRFTAMEKALSALQSQSQQVLSMFGSSSSAN